MFIFYIIGFVVRLIAVEAEFNQRIISDIKYSTAELISSRGYIAKEHNFVTSDGYILKLVQALNPLINEGKRGLRNKDPVLFLHGSTTLAKCFVINSKKVRPKDHGKLDANSMSLKELNNLLKDDPASKSLVFSALNFGHEVWLLNRRGSYEQVRPFFGKLRNTFQTLFGGVTLATKVDSNDNLDDKNELTQISHLKLDPHNDPRFWNFSLDEQALIELPEVIDYVLERTGSEKLAVVGHSFGGALVLSMLADKPEMAEKISKSLLWAPSHYLAFLNRSDPLVSLIERFLAPKVMNRYFGPFPSFSFQKLLDIGVTTGCSNKIAQRFVCSLLADLFGGKGGFQQAVRPEYGSVFPKYVSSHELISLAQAIHKGKMHHYDYMDDKRNMIAYGQSKAPIYDVSKITSESISLWAGKTDGLVTPENLLHIKRDLKVPAEYHFINETGFFNHFSFLIHDQVEKLLIIPSLKVLESI